MDEDQRKRWEKIIEKNKAIFPYHEVITNILKHDDVGWREKHRNVARRIDRVFAII